MVPRRVDGQVYLGMRFGKTPKSVHEPLRGKIRGRADHQRAPALSLQKALGPVGDTIEGIAHNQQIGAASFPDREWLPLTVEQLQAEFGLERLHLMAHRPLCDEQFFGRTCEALVPGRGLESLQGVERWQATRHSKLMRKTGGSSRNDALPGREMCAYL